MFNNVYNSASLALIMLSHKLELALDKKPQRKTQGDRRP